MLVPNINNAFVQRWSAFRRGKISWDEFQAVITATTTEGDPFYACCDPNITHTIQERAWTSPVFYVP